MQIIIASLRFSCLYFLLIFRAFGLKFHALTPQAFNGSDKLTLQLNDVSSFISKV